MKYNSYDIVPFLATPIANASTDFRLSEMEMNTILKEFSHRPHKTTEGTKLSGSKTILEKPELKRLHDFMVSSVQHYVKHELKIDDEFYLTTSWATTNSKGDKHHRHNHPNTLLSAVYYANAESGNLSFYSQSNGLFPNFDFSFNISEYNHFNSKGWTIPVKTGDLVIFPGWLYHESEINENDGLRVIVGANFFARGTYGTYDDVDLLEIK
tara:strand:+ start:679 stop:1311 length:633 start_codon:yes stop_codon:yes gene_type:complete